MTRSQARNIAQIITNEQLKQMFDAAKNGIKDWTVTSICNKGLTKGTAWNILAADFDVEQEHHIMGKTNMVREFGKYLPEELIPVKKVKTIINPIHQKPKFND